MGLTKMFWSSPIFLFSGVTNPDLATECSILRK